MRARQGRGLWLAGALVLVTVQLPVLARTGADPSQSDFANYYTPAWVLGQGGNLGALYDRDSFASAMSQAGLVGLGSFVPHPPANALWLLPLAFLPAATAKALWSAVLVGAFAVTVLALGRLDDRHDVWKAAVVVLAPTLAVRNALAFGQPYPVLGALLALGTLALDRGRDFTAGVLLGLGVSFKPYALGLGLLFLGRGRRRALVGFVCGALLPSVFLAGLVGIGPFVDFATKVVPWMLRGEIQDPFSPVWGSLSALANRLLRFEPDLNPDPWVTAPLLSRFAGTALSTALVGLGVLSGRRALDSGRAPDAIAIVIAFSLAASPFAASYHLVLLSVPAAVLASRWRDSRTIGVVALWVVLGSSAVHLFRSASGLLAPLAYVRAFAIVGAALVTAWGFLGRRSVGTALVIGGVAGVLAMRWDDSAEAWPRVESATGYSMMKPYFCGADLRWFVPSADGRRLESRGKGGDCGKTGASPRTRGGGSVVSRFTEGSWNLYIEEAAGGARTPVTHSRANEIDPVVTPDGCAVVFASDQGRGLGSTALYRLDLSSSISGCARSGPAASPR